MQIVVWNCALKLGGKKLLPPKFVTTKEEYLGIAKAESGTVIVLDDLDRLP